MNFWNNLGICVGLWLGKKLTEGSGNFDCVQPPPPSLLWLCSSDKRSETLTSINMNFDVKFVALAELFSVNECQFEVLGVKLNW